LQQTGHARASLPAPTESVAATEARTKSRFMRPIVSMLIAFGQASWHSP
jgi:hypothetical protein